MTILSVENIEEITTLTCPECGHQVSHRVKAMEDKVFVNILLCIDCLALTLLGILNPIKRYITTTS